MRVSGFTKVAWLMSLAVLVPNPFSISAFASDHEDPLSKTTVLRQIEAQPASASSSVFQPAPVSVPIPFTIGSSTPEQAGGVQVANDSPNYDTPKDKDEPGRRALPAPLDGIFPSAEYLGPSPLIGVPDTDPIYPLTKALWSTFPALKRAKIKLYGWANLSVNASTSDKSNIPESYATVPNRLDGGEDRASRICDGARIRTVHRTLVNGTLGFSCRGDTRRTGHGPGKRRFTDSICGTSIPPGGGFSVCCVVLRHRIPSRSAQRFFSTVCSDRLDGARDGHTECRCPETRNP